MKKSLEEFGNCIVTISRDLSASPITDRSFHQFCITCISMDSLHQILLHASQLPKEDESGLAILGSILSPAAASHLFPVPMRSMKDFVSCVRKQNPPSNLSF